MKQQLAWINTVKALCMIGVYALHTLSYNATVASATDVVWYVIISPFYVNAFFVVSGYLFFRKWLATTHSNDVATGVSRSAWNVLYRLIIPTILFSTLLYFPKQLFHGGQFTWPGFAYNVFGGISYWFTSAMAVCQLIMLALITVGLRTLPGFTVASVAAVAAAIYFKSVDPTPFPWYWKTGLGALGLMTLGGWIFRLRHTLYRWRNGLTLAGLTAYACAVSYLLSGGWAHNAMMSMTFDIAGVVVTLAGIAFVFILSYRFIPSLAFLQFIGRNSVLFYFFSGVAPAFISSLVFLDPLGMVGKMLISIALGAAATWCVARYAPAAVDLRVLWKR